MPQQKLFLIAILICGIFGLLAYNRARAADLPPEGLPAYDFTLPAQDGKPVSLHDFKGKWVVLYFYPRDFTSGCTLEAHGFQRDIDLYAARHAVIIGVSVNSTKSHKDFCAKEGLNFKLLSDSDHTVSDKYGSLTILGPIAFASRNTFLIDPQGNIAQIFTSVKPASHSKEVLAALDQLQHKPAAKP